jgi:hypothetical protein
MLKNNITFEILIRKELPGVSREINLPALSIVRPQSLTGWISVLAHERTREPEIFKSLPSNFRLLGFPGVRVNDT